MTATTSIDILNKLIKQFKFDLFSLIAVLVISILFYLFMDLPDSPIEGLMLLLAFLSWIFVDVKNIKLTIKRLSCDVTAINLKDDLLIFVTHKVEYRNFLKFFIISQTTDVNKNVFQFEERLDTSDGLICNVKFGQEIVFKIKYKYFDTDLHNLFMKNNIVFR